uniref:Uncharacterized protein n=1 Tax=Dasya naccarioides TaxID=2007180 RepID=A0A1Z1MGR3_9FLOR|nr:hypothetical protein [Dasya naccarioides]ARW65156.1 hypothetical protein [Dasya naccarioides]
MKFDFQEIYDNQDLNLGHEFIIMNNDDNNLDTPIGWSSIFFNETVSYYTDCNLKKVNIDEQ